MKTPIELAAEHARAYVANRGWRVEPLDWEEMKLILAELDAAYWAGQELEEAS